LADVPETFVPAPELEAWVRSTFIDPAGDLANEAHTHLNEAVLGFLWTDIPNARQGRSIVGTAEPGMPMGAMGRWAKARAAYQVKAWFGDVPDFIITIEATHAAACDDASFCALIEHELYHCAQEHDAFGAPKFSKDGRPKFTMRGHDVEEFVGVVARYGIAATGVGELVRAANKGPEIAAASIANVCGTCLARTA
jgi:hypothetical protein